MTTTETRPLIEIETFTDANGDTRYRMGQPIKPVIEIAEVIETEEQKADREERELIAALEAQAAALAGLDPTTVAEAERLAQEAQNVYNNLDNIRSRARERYLEVTRKRDKLKEEYENRQRFRIYQVWRVIDSEGYTNYTPRVADRENYAIKEVGQEIDFKSRGTAFSMCRAGTHGARFLSDAINSYHGDRAVRLELHGYVTRSNDFVCEYAKVLAIVPLEDLMGIKQEEKPAFVVDTRGQALLRYFEDDRGTEKPLGLYIDPTGTQYSRTDVWRQHGLGLFRAIADKVVADDTYQPNKQELVELYLVGEKGSFVQNIFGISLNTLVDDDTLRGFFERAVENSRNARARAYGVHREDNLTAAQAKAAQMSTRDLEVLVRKYVAEHNPEVTIKDFGVAQRADPLDPSSHISPKYWLTRDR